MVSGIHVAVLIGIIRIETLLHRKHDGVGRQVGTAHAICETAMIIQVRAARSPKTETVPRAALAEMGQAIAKAAWSLALPPLVLGGMYFGVFTATEALAAIRAGADALKFFPGDLLGPSGIKAIATILPPDVPLLAVGGVDASNLGDYLKVGVAGFGIGSSLYKPGMNAEEVGAKAREMVAAYEACAAG